MNCSECGNGEIIFIEADHSDWYQCDDCGCEFSMSESTLMQQNAKLVEALEGIINIYKVATSDGDAYSRASYVAQRTLAEVKGE